jgi:hypothetical protein
MVIQRKTIKVILLCVTTALVGAVAFFIIKSKLTDGLHKDTYDWKAAEDKNHFFTLEYPDNFIFLDQELSAFGDGVFCHQTSNLKQVLKDEEGEIRLENCLIFVTLDNQAKRDLDAFAERLHFDEFTDIDDESEKFVRVSKEKIRLGENDWIKSVYESQKDQKTLYNFLVMDAYYHPIHFSFYHSSNESLVLQVEHILSTLNWINEAP